MQCTVNLKLSYSYSAETVCIINADVNQQPFSPAFMWLYLTLPAENCLLISTVTFENMPSGHRTGYEDKEAVSRLRVSK